jgi:hypothetical protein
MLAYAWDRNRPYVIGGTPRIHVRQSPHEEVVGRTNREAHSVISARDKLRTDILESRIGEENTAIALQNAGRDGHLFQRVDRRPHPFQMQPGRQQRGAGQMRAQPVEKIDGFPLHWPPIPLDGEDEDVLGRRLSEMLLDLKHPMQSSRVTKCFKS